MTQFIITIQHVFPKQKLPDENLAFNYFLKRK